MLSGKEWKPHKPCNPSECHRPDVVRASIPNHDDARFEGHDELFVKEHIVNLLYVFARIKAQ